MYRNTRLGRHRVTRCRWRAYGIPCLESGVWCLDSEKHAVSLASLSQMGKFQVHYHTEKGISRYYFTFYRIGELSLSYTICILCWSRPLKVKDSSKATRYFVSQLLWKGGRATNGMKRQMLDCVYPLTWRVWVPQLYYFQWSTAVIPISTSVYVVGSRQRQT